MEKESAFDYLVTSLVVCSCILFISFGFYVVFTLTFMNAIYGILLFGYFVLVVALIVYLVRKIWSE